MYVQFEKLINKNNLQNRNCVNFLPPERTTLTVFVAKLMAVEFLKNILALLSSCLAIVLGVYRPILVLFFALKVNKQAQHLTFLL